jgi:DNA ligase-1
MCRSLEGKLRIGLAEKTVITAIAHAFTMFRKKQVKDVDLKESEEIVKGVYSELPSYDSIIKTLLVHPVKNLPKYCHLTPGVPLKPMLAHPTRAISDVLDRFEGKTFICEYKYDGERAQVGKFEFYSGNYVLIGFASSLVDPSP